MVAELRKRTALRRKLLTKAPIRKKSEHYDLNSVKDVLMCIAMLKPKLEAAHREYTNLMAVKREEALEQIMKHTQKVKVEKIGERFLVKVTCPKGHNRLVNILEAFEQMGLNVLQARVSCNNFFAMEAIVLPQDQEKEWKVDDISQALVEPLEHQSGLGK